MLHLTCFKDFYYLEWCFDNGGVGPSLSQDVSNPIRGHIHLPRLVVGTDFSGYEVDGDVGDVFGMPFEIDTLVRE